MFDEKTLLQSIMTEELRSFSESHRIIYKGAGRPLDIDDKGSLLIEVNSASTTFQRILTENSRKKIAEYVQADPSVYRKQLGEKIIKIEKSRTLRDAISLLGQTIKLVKDRFAGAVFITQTGALINPFHPLVALELIKTPNLTISKILIYSYTNLNEITSLYGNDDPKTFQEDIKALIRIYQSQITERSVDIVKNEYDHSRNLLIQQYKLSKYPGEDQAKEYYLAAHQLLTKGTFVPYYGTSLIQVGSGNTSGYHLTPFKSCNIQRHRSITPASVCTGSTSNKTTKGLRTLHHANLGSPYDRMCMTTASKGYADACIEMSFSMYRAAGFTDYTPIKNNVTEVTEKEIPNDPVDDDIDYEL